MHSPKSTIQTNIRNPSNFRKPDKKGENIRIHSPDSFGSGITHNSKSAKTVFLCTFTSCTFRSTNKEASKLHKDNNVHPSSYTVVPTNQTDDNQGSTNFASSLNDTQNNSKNIFHEGIDENKDPRSVR